MERLTDYITSPATIINIIVLIFWLGTTRANLNNRIKKAEDDIKEIKESLWKIDMTEIKTKLAKIEADLDRLRKAWMERHD